jgi:hypothetical protein
LQVLLIANELRLLSVGQISLDGSKIKANASKHHAYSYKHVGKVKAKLRREIARRRTTSRCRTLIFRRRSLVVRASSPVLTRPVRRSRLVKPSVMRPPKLCTPNAFAQRREQQRRTGKKPQGPFPEAPKLCVEPTAQVTLTDEESRIMPTADGFIQGYNAQAAVTMGSQFVVSTGVTQATNDKQQLAPVLERLQALPAALGAVTAIAADAGYYSEANVQACADAGVTPYLAMRREAHHKLGSPGAVGEKPIPSHEPMPPRSCRWRIACRPKRDATSMRSARVRSRRSSLSSRVL